jgi:hypothetical protein
VEKYWPSLNGFSWTGCAGKSHTWNCSRVGLVGLMGLSMSADMVDIAGALVSPLMSTPRLDLLLARPMANRTETGAGQNQPNSYCSATLIRFPVESLSRWKPGSRRAQVRIRRMKSNGKSEKKEKRVPIDRGCSAQRSMAADGQKGTIPSKQVLDEDQTAS